MGLPFSNACLHVGGLVGNSATEDKVSYSIIELITFTNVMNIVTEMTLRRSYHVLKYVTFWAKTTFFFFFFFFGGGVVTNFSI